MLHTCSLPMPATKSWSQKALIQKLSEVLAVDELGFGKLARKAGNCLATPLCSCTTGTTFELKFQPSWLEFQLHQAPRSTNMIGGAANATFKPETLSMVGEGQGSVPGYAGHRPGCRGVHGQRLSAATAHMVRHSLLLFCCGRARTVSFDSKSSAEDFCTSQWQDSMPAGAYRLTCPTICVA